MPNLVFVGTSVDGFIADRNGGLGFLECVPNPDNLDCGFQAFMDRIDALVMGRKTFEVILEFDGEWPYSKPVFVLSTTLNSVPEKLKEKAAIISGAIEDIVTDLNQRGFERLYIDGGQVIQSFLEKDMIDELVVTRVPILLGGGTPLFGSLPDHLELQHISTETFLGEVVQSRYVRKR